MKFRKLTIDSRQSTIKAFLSILLLIIVLSMSSFARPDGPGTPPPPSHGDKGGPVGGGAPVGGGIWMLLALGAAYGIRKYYKENKRNLLE